ncbi:MAG: 3-phosphoshikimate 1-carboxyvinyltransferase [Acidimicrobiia bacterium]|nr:3-phosphoshikimate 1-carboxyvinyltransferase [Acidimicrobiia bacterium]
MNLRPPDTYVVEPVSGPIQAIVRPPGSKSATNRALVLAALAGGGVTRLWGALDADDTVVMRRCLRALGIMIDDVEDPWLVLGSAGELQTPEAVLDVGASGTTARFITAVAALAPGPVRIDGTARMRERPIGDLTDALAQLGAEVETDGGTPPVRLNGGHLHGGHVRIDGSRSSQFASALLMIAPMLDDPLRVTVEGGLVSHRYVDTTIEMMRAFGAEIETTPDGYRIVPTGYRKTHIEIEADASAAVYPLVAAAITGGSMTVEGIPRDSTQPDLFVLEVLERMGCSVSHEDAQIVLAGPSTGLTAVDVDMSDAPDAALGLAVACIFAEGPSRLRGLSTLRRKETDRLGALRTEVTRVGSEARINGDDLLIVPGPVVPARVETYDDHRMAMSFALAGLVADGIEIVDPGCVSKTWPAFFDMLESIRG